MNPGKSPIGGRQITRKEALKGLGDPKKWKKEADAVYAEFRAKPVQRKATLLQRAGDTIKKALAPRPKPKAELVYAKKRKRQFAASAKVRKSPKRKR